MLLPLIVKALGLSFTPARSLFHQGNGPSDDACKRAMSGGESERMLMRLRWMRGRGSKPLAGRRRVERPEDAHAVLYRETRLEPLGWLGDGADRHHGRAGRLRSTKSRGGLLGLPGQV
jgi:hypothetical protein